MPRRTKRNASEFLTGHVPLAITAAYASGAGMKSIEHSYRHRMACAAAEDEIRRLLQQLPAIGAAGNDQRETNETGC